MKGLTFLVLAACSEPSDDDTSAPRFSPTSAGAGGVVDYVGEVEPFGEVKSTAWIEERLEAYGDVYVNHTLAASNRPSLCVAAQDAAARIDEAFTDFSRIYEAGSDAYSYEELCFLVQELSAAYGEALDPFQSAGSQILAVQARHPDAADPDDPPPTGTYSAVPLDEGWDFEGPRTFTDLLRFAKNPYATAARRMDCEADAYSWMDEFGLAESYTWWTLVEEGTLELERVGNTYAVDLEGSVEAFGTADSSGDEPNFTIHAQYEAEHCVVNLPNADIYLFDPPFW